MVIAFPLFLERMSDLLSAEKKQDLLNALPQQEPFKILYRLNCDKLFTDFDEDLSFRFTGVRRSVISNFDGKKTKSLTLTNHSQQVSMLYIIVSVTGNDLIELSLSSSWHICRVICCDFDTLRYNVLPECDAMAVRFSFHLEPLIIKLNMWYV